MAWDNNRYRYTVGLLKYIARNWDALYDEGVWFNDEDATFNPFDIAEFRADFWLAYQSLGRRMKKVIDADIDDVSDRIMEEKGYFEVKKFRREIYHRMKEWLNGG